MDIDISNETAELQAPKFLSSFVYRQFEGIAGKVANQVLAQQSNFKLGCAGVKDRACAEKFIECYASRAFSFKQGEMVKTNNVKWNDILTAVSHYMGHDVEKYGDPKYCNGRLPAPLYTG